MVHGPTYGANWLAGQPDDRPMADTSLERRVLGLAVLQLLVVMLLVLGRLGLGA